MHKFALDRYDRNNIRLNYVARAGSARIKNNNDIPLAQRVKPFRRPSLKEVGRMVLFAIVLGFGLFTADVFFNFLSPFKSFLLPQSIGKQSIDDGRLLGHLPYPEVSPSELVSVSKGIEMHKDTFRSFKSMQVAARRQGIELILLSGYRSHALQESIFFNIKSKRNQTATQRALVSAPPGHSEHSTGYAIDIGDYNQPKTDFEVQFESTKAFKWLEKNAAKYHFTLSFPKGNFQGVSYEPWHWRFEGTADALKVFEPAHRLMSNP